jgi:4-hydroxy-3-methylbut-2-enyl diphosphate reductase
MKVLVADTLGFCPGVRNAIKIARDILCEKDRIYSLGPIIHNEDVVNQLAESGLEPVDDISDIKDGTVLIRSHGATREQIEKIKSQGLEAVDATCVLVKRLQRISQSLNEEGYKVAIIGDKNHPEVQAVVGFTENIVVIGDESDIDKISNNNKLGVICQTTQSPQRFAELVGAIVERGFTELKVINTLCPETVKRQKAAVQLCRKVDIMFVLGGSNSANTKKLAQLCKRYNNSTFHLQNASQLDINLLIGKKVAGVTAGASTPDRVITEFVEKLRSFDNER